MSRQSFEAKQVLGTILSALKSYYPNALSGGNIHKHIVLPVFPGMDSLKTFQHCTALKDRGYVQYVKGGELQNADGWETFMCRITPAGLDVVNGIKEDPAILTEASNG